MLVNLSHVLFLYAISMYVCIFDLYTVRIYVRGCVVGFGILVLVYVLGLRRWGFGCTSSILCFPVVLCCGFFLLFLTILCFLIFCVFLVFFR